MSSIHIPTLPAGDADRELVGIAADLLEQRFVEGRHHVAAALRLQDGSVVTGLHLGSRRVNLCAEQVALGTVLSGGLGTPVACASVIAMTAQDRPEPTSPCGVCREVLGFFAPDIRVVLPHDGGLVTARFGDLLPAPWRLPGEPLDPLPTPQQKETD